MSYTTRNRFKGSFSEPQASCRKYSGLFLGRIGLISCNNIGNNIFRNVLFLKFTLQSDQF